MNIVKDSHFWVGILVGWLFFGMLISRVTGFVGAAKK